MTGLYRSDRLEAYTVRSDLWPPGTQAIRADWAFQPAWAHWYGWHGTAIQRLKLAKSHGYHLPGVAEAAIIAGLVVVESYHPGPWTEVTP